MVLEYKIKKGYSYDEGVNKSCDDSRRALQNIFVEVVRISMPRMVWIAWLLTRVYKKKVGETYIRYTFPLL